MDTILLKRIFWDRKNLIFNNNWTFGLQNQYETFVKINIVIETNDKRF